MGTVPADPETVETSIDGLFTDALRHNPGDRAFAVFIDVNLPPQPPLPDGRPAWVVDVEKLLKNAETIPGYQLTVSLPDQTVTDGQGFSAKFAVDPFRKFCLLEGLDDIGLTLRHAGELDKYETQHERANWLKAK